MEKSMLVFLCLITFEILHPVNTKHPVQMQPVTVQDQYDGPYVQYEGEHVYVKYIVEANGTKSVKTESVALQQKNDLLLNVLTDLPEKSFQVKLKRELQNEQSEFLAVKKLLVMSDIEGNFYAFRKLLEANKVIDENLNWTFGDGHLVLVGDLFDRGNQVTEVLWLIYYLEDKAKAAGGYVHFVLGNHEIMNLSNDLRYTPKKYLDNAALMKENYLSLYDKNSELGKWLRTKNIVEKIGNTIYTHGGISGNINRMHISVTEINTLARPYYADTTYSYNDPRTDTIFGNHGPFWYRGYYEKTNASIPAQIDSTLMQFGIRHIVTGHTIVSDTISVWYKGKLMNTDVHHASGKSEALFIEDDKYYRVNAEGDKVLLMEDADQKTN